VKTLLGEGGSAAGRKAIIEATGLNSDEILKWVNAADLLRIEGVTPDWAEMLLLVEIGGDAVRAEKPRQFHSDAPSLE